MTTIAVTGSTGAFGGPVAHDLAARGVERLTGRTPASLRELLLEP